MTVMLEFYEHVNRLAKRVRAYFQQEVWLILDPRVTAEEDPDVTGVLMAGSSATYMLAIWQAAEDHVDTLRQRQPFEHEGRPGWLISYEMRDVLDITPVAAGCEGP